MHIVKQPERKKTNIRKVVYTGVKCTM